MSFSFIPAITAPDIFAITPEVLGKKGITLLLLDLDNTLSLYSEDLPSERVIAWMSRLQAAGIALYVISNNKNGRRIRQYAEACGIPHVYRAGKPHPRALHEAMKELGKRPEETALMGDQIFTDGLAANRAGAVSIVIRPLTMAGGFGLRYVLEQPFRRLAKERIK